MQLFRHYKIKHKRLIHLAFGGLYLRKYNKQGVGDYPAVVIKSINATLTGLAVLATQLDL
jgi:hypothetical protein